MAFSRRNIDPATFFAAANTEISSFGTIALEIVPPVIFLPLDPQANQILSVAGKRQIAYRGWADRLIIRAGRLLSFRFFQFAAVTHGGNSDSSILMRHLSI